MLKERGIGVSKLILVEIDDEELIKLAVGRRMDLETHTIYHCMAHPFHYSHSEPYALIPKPDTLYLPL